MRGRQAREQSDAAALRDGAAEDVEDVGARGEVEEECGEGDEGEVVDVEHASPGCPVR